MKDFAVRIWDSKNKEMVIVTDLTLNTFYKLHTGENKEEPMLASPYYDVHGERLFENDIVLPLMKPKGSENIPWGDITKFPTTKEEFPDLEHDVEYYIVSFEDRWELKALVGVWFLSSDNMRDKLIKGDNWSSLRYANERSIRVVKIGTIYTCSKIIEEAKQQHQAKVEAEKREKELQCLLKLKAKYEGKAGECEAVE